jgi:nitrite reductase/ring-hydroxylating ferredoxin subunit
VSEPVPELPPEWYTRPEAFARERGAVFASAWQLLGRRDQVGKAGDYLAATLGGWSVFAMLGEDGELGAFHNLCRHQGLPVLDSGAGQCETLRCRYHGWTYDRQGRFLKAPAAVAPADTADPRHHLARIALATADGLVFIAVERHPPALAASVDGTGLLDRLACGGEIAIDIDANWKLVVEHRLAAGPERVRWSWPALVVETVASGAIVQQLMPRAFRRTRLVSHVYAPAGADTPAILDAARRTGETITAECQEQQRALEAGGTIPSGRPHLAPFRARLHAAHAAPEHGDDVIWRR